MRSASSQAFSYPACTAHSRVTDPPWEIRSGAVGPARWWAPTRTTIADLLAAGIVDTSLRLQQDAGTIVDRVAKEKHWQVKRQVRVEAPDGQSYRIFDFVITTRKGLIFVETVILKQPDIVSRTIASIDQTLRDQNVLAAFVVGPDVGFYAYVPENLKVVPIGDLERRLRELPG